MGVDSTPSGGSGKVCSRFRLVGRGPKLADMATNDDLKHFGSNLKALRTARSWTQDYLGERADLNPKYLGEMERGERNPSLDVIWRLARALGVDAAELVGDELTRLDHVELLKRATAELERQSSEELRTWLRVARGRHR